MNDVLSSNKKLWDVMTRFRVQVMSRMQSDLAELQKQDLTLPKWLVIMGLLDHGPMTVSELRKRLGRSQAATSQLIDSLEGKRLVERQSDPSDGRRSVVHPTRAAKALARKLEKARRDGFERVLGDLPPAVLQKLGVALTDVLDALEMKT